ncbi:ABC transporter permease [Pseudoxanthomonas composti]|uniref:FtsX-like permease family protein n=1 Tax=Pseudoxanthomonas composti TaxID=2137479 RepID=A0A4Q1JS90_9GAMM|nr:ABC transporter permease [Pseudoxanthomonas composti]RXR02065.1 FtsX-like permease family protein [Pseudoxanthomonas composti]
MLAYYFNLALRSFKRHKVLTALMVLAIGLGIGASMTTLTVFHVLSGDPMPGHSQNLYTPQIDARDTYPGIESEPLPTQFTRADAENLLRDAKGDRQVLMAWGNVGIEPARNDLKPMNVEARFNSADFFPMFRTPFLFGQGWDAQADANRARVVVITKELNDKLFDGQDSVGKDIRVDQHNFRIVGVLDDWRPTPKFYDLTSPSFSKPEQVYVPFSTSRDVDMSRSGNMDCFRQREEGVRDTDIGAGCMWMQYWVQLDTPAKAADYKRYLQNYVQEQHRAGRFQLNREPELRNTMEWLEFQRVVPSDVRLQLWLAMGFLAVCLLNTVGLLLAKFLRRSGEIGVRRALGASRQEIFNQCLVEAATVGLAGGLLGLLLALTGLWLVRQQPADYAELAQLDPAMLLTTFVLALVASLLAGLLPAWRAMQITPAVQLKSQ